MYFQPVVVMKVPTVTVNSEIQERFPLYKMVMNIFPTVNQGLWQLQTNMCTCAMYVYAAFWVCVRTADQFQVQKNNGPVVCNDAETQVTQAGSDESTANYNITCAFVMSS